MTQSQRYLTFTVDGQLYALRSQDVLEVIRVPAVARVPQGPAALLGVANLRGCVLPVVSLRGLLGKPAAADPGHSRAIVLDIGAAVAVVVDSVATLESATTERIDTRANEVGAVAAERLLGVFPIGADQRAVKILDIKSLLDLAFTNRARAQPRQVRAKSTAVASVEASHAEETTTLVTFEVAGQEFALPVEDVQEILPAPDRVTSLAHSEAVVLGLTSVRETLLPLLSLRGLLGLTAAPLSSEREKVLVVKVGGTRVGLVADRARAIVAAETRRVDPVPPAIAARSSGESKIKSVYRAHAGRLISILSPQQLFREDVMQRLTANSSPVSDDTRVTRAGRSAESICLVFCLADDEFGLPIDAVVEVARVPDNITRVPKTPRFLEGLVNLRGEVLPVVDQRRRFDMPPGTNNERRRLIVVKTERHRAGLIVDGVSDVLRFGSDTVEPAPELTDDTARLVQGVINLQKSNRMILLLDPTELLTRAERGLLDKFQAERQRAGT
jgi:purine-binding chemotaxis protein CheW